MRKFDVTAVSLNALRRMLKVDVCSSQNLLHLHQLHSLLFCAGWSGEAATLTGLSTSQLCGEGEREKEGGVK